MMTSFNAWLIEAPLWLVAAVLVLGLILSAQFGSWLRQHLVQRGADNKEASNQEGYILSAVTGLLALLIGFTFSMAIDRFDTRRARVLEEATAIEGAYFKTQLLADPYRRQISSLLIDYTNNKLLLGEAPPGARQKQLLANNERLKTELWRATVAVFPTIRSIDFSSSFVDSMSGVMEVDSARKAGRRASVPSQVFAILFVYQFVTAAVFGYVLKGRRGRAIAAFLLLLFALSIVLIIDIDRPVTGRIKESQDAMLMLQKGMRERPPQIFAPAQAVPPAPLNGTISGRTSQ